MLAATVPEHQRQRLQAVLDNGSPFGVTGLLLGQWQPGVTAYIRTDGTVSATSPGLGEALRGAHMFHLGDDATAELLTLLAQAEPDPPPQDGQGDQGAPPTVRSRDRADAPGHTRLPARPRGAVWTAQTAAWRIQTTWSWRSRPRLRPPAAA